MSPPRFMLAVHDPGRVAALRDGFWKAGQGITLNIDPLSEPPAVPSSAFAEVVVMDGEEIARHRRRLSRFLSWLSPRTCLLVAGGDAGLVETLCLPRRVDALLLFRESPHPHQIALALTGYSSIGTDRRFLPNATWRNRFEKLLTPQEQRVLGLMGKGYSNREIAATFGLAESRIKTVVRAVLRKLGVKNRTMAAVLAAFGGKARRGMPSPTRQSA